MDARPTPLTKNGFRGQADGMTDLSSFFWLNITVILKLFHNDNYYLLLKFLWSKL